ncbi:MAG: hypothetical protein HY308_07065 [Gammaproteobacteria bacterium]|nr:hypothetical protein [Gammaproteobacteria bacterium]
MPIANADIAKVFDEVADLLEISTPEQLHAAAHEAKIRELVLRQISFSR